MSNSKPTSSGPAQTRSERLNQNCFCLTLDRRSLCEALEQEAGDPGFCETFIRPKAHLFSNVPVFISASEVDEMQEVVTAIEATARLAAYKATVLSWAPEISRGDHGPVGALMGYDFHLGVDGPRLIEINTNAGGAFLNVLLAKAQRACCVEMEMPLGPHTFEDAAFRMFQEEWMRQRGTGTPHRIAIVDAPIPDVKPVPQRRGSGDGWKRPFSQRRLDRSRVPSASHGPVLPVGFAFRNAAILAHKSTKAIPLFAAMSRGVDR